MVLDVIHPSRANVSREELAEKLAAMYKSNKEQCVVFGMKTHFGGGRSTGEFHPEVPAVVLQSAYISSSQSPGFALIYDSRESMNFEPKHRLVRKGLAAKVEKASRKLRKERKNRAKSEFWMIALQTWLRLLVCSSQSPVHQRFAVLPRRRAPTRRSSRIHLLFYYGDLNTFLMVTDTLYALFLHPFFFEPKEKIKILQADHLHFCTTQCFLFTNKT
jgi:ribosomal protein S24E